jgi:hypothetical protein
LVSVSPLLSLKYNICFYGNFGVVLPVWTVSCGLLEYDEPMVEFLSIMMFYYVGRVPSNTIQCEALDFMVEFSG